MLVVANWKAHVEDATKAKLLASLAKKLSRTSRIHIVLAPPAPLLGLISSRPGKIAFAAQDISATTGGAQTGENTVGAYAAAGASYVILGHSERRAAGETETIIGEKLARTLAHGLVPILCIGEHERDKEGKYLSVIRESLTKALLPLGLKDRAKVAIAYEPVWAIGKSAQDAIAPSDLAEMILYIRKVLAELLPGTTGAKAVILYGGSVEAGNARTLSEQSGIDGFLVGHASAEPDMFGALVRALS